ncbi:MAG: hypothetical protein QNJ91_07620 [Gammaproteobacteria bacterium]|nr:hypothetical protein [Gammaproteobacteria bacterium]
MLALLLAGRRKRPAWLLVSLIAALPVFYVVQYLLLQSLQGWPVDDALPEQFELVAFDVVEPRDGSADGAIHLWVRAEPTARPRAYRLAYSRELHQSVVDAGRKMSAGKPQFGDRQRARGAAGSQSDTAAPPQVRFHDESPVRLPRKPGSDT